MSVVLDASAVLAVLNGESGAEVVRTRAFGAKISSVNVAEIGTRLVEGGLPADVAVESVNLLGTQIVDFDVGLATITATLRTSTRKAGLSLADRACIALALRDGLPALTADRPWKSLDLDVEVELIR